MKKLLIYVHGKGGAADEAEHYKPLFPGFDVTGFDYKAQNPWEAKEEFPKIFGSLSCGYEQTVLIANSIGAYFSLCSGISPFIDRAYFISPIVDMEKLITDMLLWANSTEEELRAKGVIHTASGEDLSWEYLSYARDNPVNWNAPTEILYGGLDSLTSRETITAFARRYSASLTVMEDGEHWFHTQRQICFLDNWISRKEQAAVSGRQ